MKRAIQEHAKDFGAIIVLLVLSVVISGYILTKERLRFPLVEASPVTMFADMSTGQAFTPGQGQSVRVSGVQIGLVKTVTLRDGRAVMQLSIDPQWSALIHTDATVLARPRTGLQDMFLEVVPGRKSAPMAKEGFTIPVTNTMPEVNSDEILGALDADTRTYLNLLVNGAGRGLAHNGGNEIGGLLQRFLPAHRDLARLNGAVAVRRFNLRRLVNSLQRLNTALVAKQSQIVQMIDASSTVFRAFASENGNVSRAIADLPATLRQTTATLVKVQNFANVLGPTSLKLLPAARALPAANQALAELARPSTPIIQHQIRPFVIAARPLVRNLRPAAINLAKATPDLTRSFVVLNHLFNMLGYNPGDSPDSPQHGYLWWLAWGDHIARTLFSIQDANGPIRPLFAQISCATLAHEATGAGVAGGPAAGALVSSVLNLGPVSAICSGLGLGGSTGQAQTARSKAAAGAAPGNAGAGASAGGGSQAAGASAAQPSSAGAGTSGAPAPTGSPSSTPAGKASAPATTSTATTSSLTSTSPAGGGR